MGIRAQISVHDQVDSKGIIHFGRIFQFDIFNIRPA